jgi:hypothetical protein
VGTTLLLVMIEIVEIIWKHNEEEALQQATIPNGEEEEWTTTNTMDVGGALFALVKPIIIPTTATSTTSRQEHLLVAAGKSYLSYLYMGICSTVLYLDIATTDNSAVLFLSHNNNNNEEDMPIALEIYYHKPARAIDLAWATNKFIEANLVSTSDASKNKSNNKNNKNKISNLSPKIQSQLTQFNSFYRNINNGDRYTLLYIPQIGIQLYLNNNILLGTIDFDSINMTITEQYDLARILYSVWFGPIAPFSTTMRDELLVPLSRPTITTAIQSFQRNAMNASSFNMNTNNSHHHYHHHHRQDGGLQRALLGIANDIYYDTMLRGTTIAMILLVILSLWKKMMTMTTTTKTGTYYDKTK